MLFHFTLFHNHRRLILLIAFCFMINIYGTSTKARAEGMQGSLYEAVKVKELPVIDGLEQDACWEKASWGEIQHLWLGQRPSAQDFNGRYKVVWSDEKLYFLIEITDDVLSDTHKDPLVDYYKDDTLEIFIDEDHSGGDHAYNHNAIAYHIAMDFNAVDIGSKGPALFNDHLKIQRSKSGNTYLWEIELKVFPYTYDDNSHANQPVTLIEKKEMGFGIAYCDNDGGEDRESFMGSFDILGDDKNQAWKNASIFALLRLMPRPDDVKEPNEAKTQQVIQRYYVGQPYFYLGDKKIEMDTSPVIKEGRTFLPIRYVIETLGAQVLWDKKERKTSILWKDRKIELWVGKNNALVDGNLQPIDSTKPSLKPFILKGRVMLPLRFVSENLGLHVSWSSSAKEIVVS